MTKLLFAGVLCVVLTVESELAIGIDAATLTVTKANDSGPGSLRDAVALASPGDNIQFDAALARIPILLTTGELLIDKNLMITGLGRDSTLLDGNSSSRILNARQDAIMAVSNLTIRNGFEGRIVSQGISEDVIAEGGGIFNAGDLTLEKCFCSRECCNKHDM